VLAAYPLLLADRKPPTVHAAHAAEMITLRVRTKDGMERLKVDATVTLVAVRELVSTQLGVPLEEQVRRQLPERACGTGGSHRALLVAAHLALRTNRARCQEGCRFQPC